MGSVQAFGDIHGRDNWRTYIAEKFDHIIFIGDYFDNEKIPGDRQIANFIEILDWKRRWPNKVHLLFGNHDYHYLSGINEVYSGWEYKWSKDIVEVLNSNIHYLQPSFTLGNVVFCHAGITNAFAERVNLDTANIDISLQHIFETDRKAFALYGDCTDGNAIDQSSIWVRPPYLVKDKLKGYQFVVGHTQQERINFIGGCAFIDTQAHPLECEDLTDLNW